MSTEGNRSKKAFLVITGSILIVLLSPIIYFLADASFGGKEIKQFCQESFVGKPSSAIESLAKQRNFPVLAYDDGFFVVRPEKRGGHSCHVQFNAEGIVSKAEMIYRF